jgi:glycosyltransferase involved in cell wall biosynthesis
MPAYNEEHSLVGAHDEVERIFTRHLAGYDYEVIVVDNCSTDSTERVARDICASDDRWRYVKFSRNFGSEISIAAGLAYARGDAVIILFSDLQDPPELIPAFVAKWEEGYEVVSGRLTARADQQWWKGLGARCAYFILKHLTDIGIPQNVTDFRLLSRPVVNAINHLQERNRYFRGLAHWAGFATATIDYVRRPRAAGESKAHFLYLIDFTLRAWTNFSIVPLRFFSALGGVVLVAAIVYAALTVALFVYGSPVPGLTTVYVLLLAILGVLSTGIGALGEYVGRIYLETKQRPLWIVAAVDNIDIPESRRYGGF